MNPWYNLAMLAAESQHVIFLRLTKLGAGGTAALDEAQLMVSEKMEAARHATERLMLGDFADAIVTGYRETVQANVQRLQVGSGDMTTRS